MGEEAIGELRACVTPRRWGRLRGVAEAWGRKKQRRLRQEDSGSPADLHGMDERDGPPTPWETAARLFDQADTLLEMRRTERALPLLYQAISLDPEDGQLRCQLARALLAQGDLDGALQAAREAAVLDPDDEWPHRLRAIALMRLERPEEALAAAVEAVRIDPDVPRARSVLVDALLGKQRKADAFREAEQLVRMAPEEAFAHAALARVAEFDEDWPFAEGAYRRAASIDPEDADARRGLARALQSQNRDLEAIRLLQDTVRLDPGDDNVREQLYGAIGVWIDPEVNFIQRMMRRVHLMGGLWSFYVDESERRLRARWSPRGFVVLMTVGILGSLGAIVLGASLLLKRNPLGLGVLLWTFFLVIAPTAWACYLVLRKSVIALLARRVEMRFGR